MLTDRTDRTDFFRNVLWHHGDDGIDGFCEHCMLTSLLARCCDYINCANVFRHGYVTGQ